ncbi:MFS transporter [Rivularia sp. UHCC 0363]|uniref:MFS transporter n=1 Tax=Rivularia sp. UHCC 0363 TaxID=3110244 RepID=UPI002B1EAB43|nr:MFS transporter [Rivularia sp. UHCC 0363]MEA5598208.1 MFS transporter [Rivularia sp. UHCC 0363]
MLRSVLQLPNFRLLWLGQTFILCASQFWFVALTWLILEKTGSGLAIGTVLMAAAIPRGIFMLIGGAIGDRLPTNSVAAIAASVNTVLIGLVAVLLFFDVFQLGTAVLIAALFGLSEAFLYPAILALVPQVISKPRLRQANAWMQGSEQITNVIGPAAAGIIIGALGLPIAFTINMVLLTVGSGFIYWVRIRRRSWTGDQLSTGALAGEIMAGLRYAWKQPAIRISLLLIATINFAILGPIVIGVAELVTVRFGGSATMFGYLQSAYGIGALLGVLIASRLSAIKNLKTPLVLLACSLGVGLILLGFMQQAWMAAVVIALMGVGGGIVGVLGLTWLQQQTATYMQGRMMSLVMFAAIALDPFSQAISGVLLEINLTGLFVSAGMMMLLTALVSSLSQTSDRSR